jgi:GNAT superfamily N-acetyltransferase
VTGVELRGFDEEQDLAARSQLFVDAFPEHRADAVGSQQHYTWKFRSAPARPQSFEYVATENGVLLGYYAAIPFEYVIDGTRMKVGVVCDVMTHSAARGRGVFTELGRHALEEMRNTSVDLVTGYPIRPEVMGGHLRVGWRVAFELPVYLKPLRANAALSRVHLAPLAPLANPLLAGYRTAFRGRLRAEAYETVEGESQALLTSPEFREFVAAWESSVRNHLVKTRGFYAWRLGAPEAEYRVFLVRDAGAVVAAAIARDTHLGGIPCAALLDVMVLEDRRDSLPSLYSAVERYARMRDLEGVATMMSRRSARHYRLLRSGFLRTPYVFKLIIRSVSDAVDVGPLAREDDWHLMWIDSDDL